MESNITGLNNAVGKVPEVTKEYEEEDIGVKKDVNSDDADEEDDDDDDDIKSILP